MANLIVPAKSDLALALREPNLLAPGLSPRNRVFNPALVDRADLVLATDHTGTMQRVKKASYDSASGVVPSMTKNIGLAPTFDATGDHLTFVTLTPAALEPETIIVVYKPVSWGTSGDFGRLVCREIKSGEPSNGVDLYLRSASSGIRFSQNYTVDGICDLPCNITFGEWHIATVRQNQGHTSVAVTNSLINGRDFASDTFSCSNPFESSNTLKVGNRDALDRGFDGSIAFVVGFFDWLSEAEIEQIHRNFFNTVFKPANDTPYLLSIPGGAAGVTVTPTGVSSTTAVGTLSVVAEQNVSVALTGNAATSGIGTLTASTGASVSEQLSGNAAASGIGSLTATAEVNASAELSGTSATSAVGSLSVEAGGSVSVTPSAGVATGTVGTLSVVTEQNVSVSLTGTSATTGIGDPTIIVGTVVTPAGIAASSGIGTLLASTEQQITYSLSGVAATSAVGELSVSVPEAVTEELTGLYATGAVGVLGVTVDDETWTEIAAAETSWSDVSASSTVWTEI